MNRFTTGLLAGGIVTALGVSYAMNDKRTKRKMIKGSKKMASKAGSMIDDLTDNMF